MSPLLIISILVRFTAMAWSVVLLRRLRDWRMGFLRQSGYLREEAIGQTTADLGLWTDPADPERMAQLLQAEGRVQELECVLRNKTGAEGTFLMSAEIFDLGGEACVVTAARDVTEQRRLEQEILEISHQEQRRIGQDLHDGLGQLLTGVS